MTGSVLGIDVGWSTCRQSSAVCRLSWRRHEIEWEIRRFRATDEERRSAILGVADDHALSAVAVDGPLAPGFGSIGRYRSAERLLSRGDFQRRVGKPGQSSSPNGRRLNEQANLAAMLVKDTVSCCIEEAAHSVRIDRYAVVEAFPTTFLGVLIDRPEEMPDRPGKKSDRYYAHLTEERHLDRLLESLLPGRRLAKTLSTITNHDDRAAMICALTALCVAIGDYTAVGDSRDGWIILPPRHRFAAWAWRAVARNETREREEKPPGEIRTQSPTVARAHGSDDLTNSAADARRGAGLKHFARTKLQELRDRRLLRTLIPTERRPQATTRQKSRDLISFACNDYLGLSHHPKVIEASRDATRTWGAGAGASRLISGNNPLYAGLERALAKIKNTEDAVVFGSGYLANIGIIPALAARQDLVLMDELCHACLHAGATLTRCRTLRYRHRDTSELTRLLREHRPAHRHCLVLTDGVFSMDGDRAPVDKLLEICDAHNAWLMTDDAHGLGVIENGRGSGFVDGRAVPVPLQMGTLSKAVGAYGGYLCTNRDVADLIRNRARSLHYTTGLPPGTLAAATAALGLIATDRLLVRAPLDRARRFADRLGLESPESPIMPIVLGDAHRTMQAAAELRNRGFLVGAIRPPTVPDGTARLRLTFSAVHAEKDVDRLAAAVEEVLPDR